MGEMQMQDDKRSQRCGATHPEQKSSRDVAAKVAALATNSKKKNCAEKSS
jgi:hypothetical protein